ncbi:unnamed protein product [Peronospora destructor]|uniref:TOG domain-containing protein n=1 Tax=Peronospora destructor TaxID=86335 RepID=A0AAV0URN2_9STRA|nr:unnamed protein product [Peronospora destructor]
MNAVLELGTRLIQPEEEWKDKCVAFQELRQLISNFWKRHNTPTMAPEATKDAVGLFTPQNVQALTQPFRVTVADLRSTVVKEACTTLSLLTTKLGPVRCKMLVRDVFPTLLEARGGSNKVDAAAVHNCIKAIVATTPSQFVLAPVLQVLDTSKNRDVRESCIHYTFLALEGWKTAVLERFKIPLQPTIAASLSDASAKGREKARDCYWTYISIWPDEVNRMNQLLPDGVKKHLKWPRKVAGLETSHQPPKRRHLATITNTVSWKSAAKNLLPGDDKVVTNRYLGKLTERLGMLLTREALPGSGKQVWTRTVPLPGKHGKDFSIASIQPSRIPSTPISSSTPWSNAPSKIPTPQPLPRTRTTPEAKSTAILEDKCAQFQRENAFLAKKLKIQAQDLQRLYDQIQMMSEGRQLNEVRHKDATTAIMTAHDVDRVPQHDMQCKLAKQIASRDDKLEDLRGHDSPLPSCIPLPNQDQNTTQKSKLFLMMEKLQAAKATLETRNAEAGEEMTALRSEKSVLEDHVSAQSAQLEKLQTQQNAAAVALAEEKDGRVAQLEGELSLLTEQLQAATAKAEATNAEAGEEMTALRSEKSVLEDLVSAQSAQLEELQTQQNAAAVALAEEKHLLANDLSASRRRHLGLVALGDEKGSRRSDGSADEDHTTDRSGGINFTTDDGKAKPAAPIRAFSLARTRDRFEIEDEERRINEANLLKRRLRRQNHKRKA